MSEQDHKTQAELHGTRLTARAVYGAISRDGEEELERAVGSLWWSGIGAGLVIATSILAKGLLHEKLPDAPWRSLVENLGYTIGFIIVILGRLQLFTENTITVILPLITQRTRRVLFLALRLWVIVFLANIAGTLLAAFVMHHGLVADEHLHAMVMVSAPLLEKAWLAMLLEAIPAGFLVAAIVWLLPNSRGFELWMILITSYLIGLGGFPHIVVGSFEAFLLLLAGKAGVLTVLWSFLVPALIGNIIGGTALFSLLAYGQVRGEIEP